MCWSFEIQVIYHLIFNYLRHEQRHCSNMNSFDSRLLWRYDEAGINVGEIKIVAFVAPLKWVGYKPSGNSKSYTYELAKCWNDEKWQPIAVQMLIKSVLAAELPALKFASDELRVPDVFLFGGNGKTHHYGELAQIVDTQSLETNGRVNSK